MTLLTTSNCRNVVAVVMVTTRCMLKVCPSPSLSQCMLFPQSFSNSSPLSTIMSSKWLCCVMCHVCVVYFTAQVSLFLYLSSLQGCWRTPKVSIGRCPLCGILCCLLYVKIVWCTDWCNRGTHQLILIRHLPPSTINHAYQYILGAMLSYESWLCKM